MASIVINNTAVRNNGDVALVAALAKALTSHGHRLAIATPDTIYARLVPALVTICPEVRGFRKQRYRKAFWSDLAAIALLMWNRTYRESDVIIGAPGGYLNSRYGPLGWRLAIYRWASHFGKRTAIYSQSIDGLLPLDAGELSRCASSLALLVARDSASFDEAQAAGVPAQKLLLTNDAVFLEVPDYSKISSTSDLVGISVRDWKHGPGSRDSYLLIIAGYAQLVLERGYRVEFFSTCQGVPGYIDDSLVAKDIVALMPTGLAAGRVTVNHEFMTIGQLRARIAECHMIIGTRMHMCLLAILAGVPAFNISYEPKGHQCFRYLGLEKYSIDYHEDEDRADKAFQLFLAEKDEVRLKLPEVATAQHRKAWSSLNQFLNLMGLD